MGDSTSKGHGIVVATTISCAALLAIFAALAWTAVLGKSATTDEGYHAIAGWLALWQHDDRLDSGHPPLWKMYATLPNGPGALRSDYATHDWSGLPMNGGTELIFMVNTLYRTPGNDGIGFVNRQRAMMLLIGLALGAGIAAVGWNWARAGGADAAAAAVAALTACGLFCLDPNFLAHSPLMKNDVAAAATMLAVVAAVWAVGRRLSGWRIGLLAVACILALGVKFSGIGMVAIGMAMLIVRALLPWPWTCCASAIDRAATRLAAAVGVIAITSVVTFAGVWAVYGFRFRPAPAADSAMDLQSAMHSVIERKWQAQQPGNSASPPTPGPADLGSVNPPVAARLVMFAATHRLLPQAFCAGLLFTEQSALVRPAFLCGHFSRTGWWWYFPLAMAVKTPTATIALAVLAAVLGGWWLLARRASAACTPQAMPNLWTTLCWLLPSAAYLAAAMASNLDLGIRHVLPVYPLLFVAIGLAASKMWKHRPKATLAVLLLATAGLATESLAAYPNFIPFFNTLAGGSRGGLRLLSDSNLDWGQDLPLLAEWQRAHPDVHLYLAYFGSTDPAYYGIHYTNLPGGYRLGPPWGRIDSPGVIAISASLLQGTYDRDRHGRSLYAWLMDQSEPFAVLGGSIYLFHYPPAAGETK